MLNITFSYITDISLKKMKQTEKTHKELKCVNLFFLNICRQTEFTKR